MKDNDYPKLHLPEGFDERSEYETPFKGYLRDAQVELEDGNRYKVFFIDPVRLRQDLEEEVKLGRPYFAEVGMIVLPRVTVDEAKEAIKFLLRDGFFANLKPL